MNKVVLIKNCLKDIIYHMYILDQEKKRIRPLSSLQPCRQNFEYFKYVTCKGLGTAKKGFLLMSLG